MKAKKTELPGPIPLTYGIEIEATVVITHDPVPGLGPGVPAPIRIPSGCEGTAETFDHIRREMQRVLQRRGLPTEAVAVHVDDQSSSLSPLEKLGAYSFFDVKDDWSIDTPHAHLASFEISTPVAPDTASSYQVLRYAINLLTSSFLVTVNPSCGLHVHVGQAEGFTHDAFRRTGSLLWAVDPLLLMLNPPWRAVSVHSPSIRHFSALARRAEAEQLPAHDETCRYLRGGIRYGERSQAWRETHPEAAAQFIRTRAPGHFEPYDDGQGTDDRRGSCGNADDQDKYDFGRIRPGAVSPPASSAASSDAEDDGDPIRALKTQRQIAQRIAPLTRRSQAARERLVPLPRLRLARHSHKKLSAWRDRLLPPAPGDCFKPGEPAPDLGLYPGVRRIYEAETSCEIAALLTQDTSIRMNFNVGPYRCDRFVRPGTPRTIEFRGAEGSLDPEWVCCWARICVGLVRFAMNAPPGAFLEVLRCCNEAGSGAPYDIIDFLCHVGLLGEAHIAARRVRENTGQWQLEFEEE